MALNALDAVPKCPNCGDACFARASLFDTRGLGETPVLDGRDDIDWLAAVRDDLEPDGDYLVHRDGTRVTVMPLVGEWIKIGRSLSADIRFDDPTVSRRHAIIARQDEGVRVLDDRSLNGLFLNGSKVEWGELEDGDELIVGRYRLYYLDASVTASAAGAAGERAAA